MSEQQPYESDLTADRIHRGGELLLWRSKHPSLVDAVARKGSIGVNGPLVTQEAVIGIAASPSLIWAVWKSTGELAWSRSFNEPAQAMTSENLVYAFLEERIICLNGHTGETCWETPYWLAAGGAKLDVIAAQPSLANGRIFWSNPHVGLVTCADANTGAIVWRTSREGVLSPLLSVTGVVIGAELPSSVFAFDAKDGRPVWTRQLPKRSELRLPVAAFGGVLVSLSDSVVLLRTEDGAIVTSWSWPEHLISHAAGGEDIAFISRCDREDVLWRGQHFVIPRRCQIVRLNRDGSVRWELASIRGPVFTWDEVDGRLVEACGGIAIIDPEEGRRTHLISLEGTQVIHAPAAEKGRVYATTIDGELLAFQYPVDT